MLVSATGGIDDAAERAARRAADEALAATLERDGLDAFLDPLGRPAAVRRRSPTPTSTTAAATPSPGWRRACAWPARAPRSRCGTACRRSPMPVLLVAGARDAKFVAAAERMAALVPDATLAIVEGAGHTVHLEQPAAFVDVLRGWLRR